MKMYDKSELTLDRGLLVTKDGDIVMPMPSVVKQANDLELLVQQAEYLRAQPDATPMPSLDGFVRRTELGSGLKFDASTPKIDAKIEEAMAIMDEIDDVKVVREANDMLARFSDLVDFVRADKVIDVAGDMLLPFDTPVIGSVLEMTTDDVMHAVAFVCGMTEEGDKPGIKRIYASDMSDEEFDALLGIIAKHDDDFAQMLAEDKKLDGIESTDDMKADEE